VFACVQHGYLLIEDECHAVHGVRLIASPGVDDGEPVGHAALWDRVRHPGGGDVDEVHVAMSGGEPLRAVPTLSAE
jgi:hypothetical protein